MGDPFTEKLLIEATLEALETGLIVGIQDMGAAGITCSTCETAAQSRHRHGESMSHSFPSAKPYDTL